MSVWRSSRSIISPSIVLERMISISSSTALAWSNSDDAGPESDDDRKPIVLSERTSMDDVVLYSDGVIMIYSTASDTHTMNAATKTYHFRSIFISSSRMSISSILFSCLVLFFGCG